MKMSNNKNIKEIFSEKINKDVIFNNILTNVQRKERNNLKYYKVLIIPACIIMIICTFFIFNKNESLTQSEFTNNVKVYAYMDANNNDKKELKENIKVELSSYNHLMSSVPGYPISFILTENYNLDYIDINVKNGSILEWNNENPVVKDRNTSYKIKDDKILYFNVNENTIITITGIKNEKQVFSKNITITEDEDFNYYATLK